MSEEPPPRGQQVAANIARIRDRITAAAARAGRSSSDITLMAVTKTQPAARILEAYRAGIRSFGENRVQEFQTKSAELEHLQDASFTLIGQLQSNKVNKAIELFSAIYSVDSLRLAERLNAALERGNRPPLPIAIEINIGDPAKAGLAPGSPELEQLLLAAERVPHLRIQGLMTIPPFTENPEDARPYFRRLRELRDRIAERKLPGVGMDVLSMGMSHDFEVAVEEGSTCVRIGTAIFGERPKQV
ncbi:MAG: YggS family pyridoxal phosphate-dependent enzyme [Acidobacteria bacterium]|nr:YggS family pyridoxal phosphate-dependent enzyme [Acidobacteriota bacterium]MBV9148212.1 YggS family pyridoxal phosphate-dependent enzyme [Acidobacteriota bacterium]